MVCYRLGRSEVGWHVCAGSGSVHADDPPALLWRLPASERIPLLASCDRVLLQRGEVLAMRHRPTPCVYFPVDCAVTLLVPENGRRLEVALVGNEGMVGVEVCGPVGAPAWDAVCAIPGSALRLRTERFHEVTLHAPRLREAIGRFEWVLGADLAARVACVRFHSLLQRLAGWLLMATQRCGHGPLRLTQADLAAWLGVRRAGVTHALRWLDSRHCIEVRRGRLRVLDERMLADHGCSCHAASEGRYEHVFGGGALRGVPLATTLR